MKSSKPKFLKKSEAEALIAAGGWTPDPEFDDDCIPRRGFVNDQGQLLLLSGRGKSPLWPSRKKLVEEMAVLAQQKPQHILEGRMPHGADFPTAIPGLIEELPARLKLPRESLDYSMQSLERVDAALKGKRRKKILDDNTFFLGLVAYTGEVIRKVTNGRWEMHLAEDVYEPWIIGYSGRRYPVFSYVYRELDEEPHPGPICIAGSVRGHLVTLGAPH